MKVAIVLNEKEINDFGFPVVVEGWKNIGFGRGRRQFNAEFPTTSDKTKARYWRRKFHNWYLVKGTPRRYTFRPETLLFIRKLCNFFGTL